jgi:thymidine kinase
MSTSYLEMALGPMFASKTSWLIAKYKQYKVYTNKILVINYFADTRYSETCLTTHDKIEIPCVQTDKLESVIVNHNEVDIILINEGQFFEDIVPWVKNMVDHHQKQIYICGLDGDFKRQRFGTLLDLIPHCDKVTKLTALCGICKDGTRAIFTHRTCSSTEQVLIGEKDSYIPVCRKCYNMNMQNNIN